ncbi:MAG: hypothetical protein WCJ30_06565, partial [Deltaproteobacteria bacterium]
RETPTESDLVGARVALVAMLRTCVPSDGWTVRVHAVIDQATGRLALTPPEGAAWTPEQTRCLAQASRRVRGPRFTADHFETDLTLDGHDPRPDLLRTIDVRACFPAYDPGRCHLHAAVATSARRPSATSAVTWDVQGCIVSAEQLACVEARIGSMAWPVNRRDPGSFRGAVGTAGR